MKNTRQPGNIKIPFWLEPVKYYKGVAWYQKDVEIPENWTGQTDRTVPRKMPLGIDSFC